MVLVVVCSILFYGCVTMEVCIVSSRYFFFRNAIWVCADVCFVSSVVECGLFLESGIGQFGRIMY